MSETTEIDGFTFQKDALEELYYEQGQSIYEVADEFGVEATDVVKAMVIFDMKRHADVEDERPWRDKDRLEELYVEEGLSMAEVADELGCTAMTIKHWLDEFDLKEAGMDTANNPENSPWRDEETLRDCYERAESVGDVAEELGCAPSTASEWLDKFGIREQQSTEESEAEAEG